MLKIFPKVKKKKVIKYRKHRVASISLKISKTLTSDKELLSIYPGISFGFLQQTDPVMHLLWCVAVAVDHTIGRNDDERVWPENMNYEGK